MFAETLTFLIILSFSYAAFIPRDNFSMANGTLSLPLKQPGDGSNNHTFRAKRDLDLPYISNAGRCVDGPPGRNYGCHRGGCWAYCGISMTSGEWCYTTDDWDYASRNPTNALRITGWGRYNRCEGDEDCDPCWWCEGLCTYF